MTLGVPGHEILYTQNRPTGESLHNKFRGAQQLGRSFHYSKWYCAIKFRDPFQYDARGAWTRNFVHSI